MILGIGGGKGCGKDTVADILIKHYNYRKISWADPLKEMLSEALNIPLNEFYDRTKDDIRAVEINAEEAGKLLDLITESYGELENYTNLRLELQNTKYESLRDLMQRFGTEFGRRKIDPEIWIKLTKNRVNPGDLLIFPDVRFKGEFDAIKELGGFMMKINRDLDNQDSHESENLDIPDSEFDFLVDNNACLSSLHSDIILFHRLRFPEIERV